jgi:Aldehyde oxidase and xanthine dehydrogenase, a/b hammerhead domain
VLTGADAVADKLGSLTAHLMPEDVGAPKGHRTFQPALVAEHVRFVGDRVAFVVAETLTQARDAAELVEVGKIQSSFGMFARVAQYWLLRRVCWDGRKISPNLLLGIGAARPGGRGWFGTTYLTIYLAVKKYVDCPSTGRLDSVG